MSLISKKAILTLIISNFFVFAFTNLHNLKNVWVEQLDEENWDRMLTGEWMVELYVFFLI